MRVRMSVQFFLLFLLVLHLTAADRISFDLEAADGGRHRSAELRDARAGVLIFLATDCPISNRYAPVIHELESEYKIRGVMFFAVFSGVDSSAGEIKKHLADFSLDMPGLLDPGALLAKQTGARVTPEAVVISPDGRMAYTGRIDNRYVDWGKTRPEATEHDLKDALEAVLARRAVAHATTKALGCAISGL